MDEDDDDLKPDLKPKSPPPPWIEEFRKDIREALAQAKRENDADPNPEMFDPPEGRSLIDGQAQALVGAPLRIRSTSRLAIASAATSHAIAHLSSPVP